MADTELYLILHKSKGCPGKKAWRDVYVPLICVLNQIYQSLPCLLMMQLQQYSTLDLLLYSNDNVLPTRVYWKKLSFCGGLNKCKYFNQINLSLVVRKPSMDTCNVSHNERFHMRRGPILILENVSMIDCFILCSALRLKEPLSKRSILINCNSTVFWRSHN